MAMQLVHVPRGDAPITAVLVMLAHFLGAALFTSITKTAFLVAVKSALRKHVPALDANALIYSGVRDIWQTVPAGLVNDALMAHNEAIYLQLAAALVTFVTGCEME
ncbi:hypothetical protein HD806DRAFT_534102 [Xylariaceae sp. AK1471]|nr:hypothetical protein HD806DRAFT_534102 [Xylariaceae sp. AK1471]